MPKSFPASTFDGRLASPDERGAACRQASVDSLRPAQSELDDRIAARRFAYARRFRRDERLEVDDREEQSLDKLSLEDRAADAHERLAGKDDRAFGNGLDVALEPQGAEVLEEIAIEQLLAVAGSQAGEVAEVVGRESELRNQLEGRREAASNAIGAAKGTIPEVEVENALLLVGAGLPVGLRHGDLVEVREECDGGAGNHGRLENRRMTLHRNRPSRGNP
jgi:hypothetical protein